MRRIPEEQDHVRSSLREDLHRLEDGEAEGLVLLPELGEKYGRGAVQCKNAPNVNDAVAEALISEGGGDSVPEQYQEGEEGETRAEAWKMPRLERQASGSVSKYLKRILSRKSLTIPGSAAIISGME